jgi:hypothetical protein
MSKKHLIISFISIFLLIMQGCTASQSGTVFLLDADLKQSGKHIEVKGTANLPDQAMILVSWLDPEKEAAMNQNIVVQEFAFMAGGQFSAVLKPLKEVSPGHYKVRLRFSPTSYDPSNGGVHAAVGSKGENLAGPQVVQEEDIKMLVNLLEIDYQ